MKTFDRLLCAIVAIGLSAGILFLMAGCSKEQVKADSPIDDYYVLVKDGRLTKNDDGTGFVFSNLTAAKNDCNGDSIVMISDLPTNLHKEITDEFK